MLGDPMKGFRIALGVAAGPLVWFLALWFAPDALFARFGMGMHAITFLLIFAFLAALATAGIFHRLATVKAELLAGRRVLARWMVGEAEFNRFVPGAVEDDRRDKRQALYTVWAFLALIFGGFALYDPEAAPAMIAVAVFVALIVGIAYLFGQGITRKQLQWRSGEVIVGERGLILNGVLHCWGIPFSWLSSAALDEGRGILTVMYAFLSRYGPQYVTVDLPVTAETMDMARIAEQRLLAIAGKRKRPRRPRQRALPPDVKA